MSLFARLEQRSSKHPQDPALVEWWGGGPRSSAGVSVTADRALGVMAVYAAVRLISETLAALPLVLYRRLDRGRERAPSHPLYPILHDSPNDWQTALEWREMMQAHVLLRGNAYAKIVETKGGYVEQLIPLHPDRVTPRNERLAPGGPKVRYYYYQPLDDEPQVFLPNEVFHVRGLSSDGFSGLSPLSVAREALGLAIAAEEHGARHFANNVQPGGVLEATGRVGDKAYERLKKDLEARRAGTAHVGKTLILEEGLKWHQIGLTNKDAQFLESRKFQVSEIARMFKVPPHMIADLERATFSNIEHQAIEFVTHTMLPWLVRWEQRLAKDMLGDTERRSLFLKFNADGLLRGDTKSRYEAYAIGRQWGWLSADDVREREDQNPLPDKQGTLYMVPLNMIPADQAAKMPASPEPNAAPAPADPVDDEEGGEEDERAVQLRQRLELAHVRLFLDAAQRVLRKEISAATRAIAQARSQKSSQPVDRFVETFYDGHDELVARTLLPAVRTTVESIGAVCPDLGDPLDAAALDQLADSLAAAAGRRHVARQLREARKCLSGSWEERAMALEKRAKGWENEAGQLAGPELETVTRAAIAAVRESARLLPAST